MVKSKRTWLTNPKTPDRGLVSTTFCLSVCSAAKTLLHLYASPDEESIMGLA